MNQDFHTGDVLTAEDARDLDICREVMSELQRHYPNHNWHVEANAASGHVVIKLPYPDKMQKNGKFGVLLHLRSMDSASGFVKKILWAGGELLERFGLPRSGATVETVINARLHGLEGV